MMELLFHDSSTNVPKQYAYLHMVINEKWQGIPMKNVGGIA